MLYSNPKKKIFFFSFIIILTNLVTTSASAHAFGSRYDLPLPLWMYLAGAGSAVGFSFLIMIFFATPNPTEKNRLQINLLEFKLINYLSHKSVRIILKATSLSLFILLILVGFLGDPNPLKNITPIFVWVVWWVGMAFISAIFGNLWSLVNPWSIFFEIGEWIFKKVKYNSRYPIWCDKWPIVILFFIFAWMELITDLAEQPRMLSSLIIFYSFMTWTGMFIFGRRKWLENGEVFHAIFNLFSRFAPINGKPNSLVLRVPSSGLLVDRPVSMPETYFVLLLLSTVTFDGILETPLWMSILTWISENLALRPLLIYLQEIGVDIISLIKLIALLVIPCTFFSIFFSICHIIGEFGSGGKVPTRAVIGYFVFSLVPIAIAYHLSHYLSYLLIAGQQIIPLISDPFSQGWNIFGTVGYRIDIGIINAKLVWYLAIVSIIVGHIFAVYISHLVAIQVFPDRKAALSSQYPMMVLMISYTMLSLWILSQPIVE